MPSGSAQPRSCLAALRGALPVLGRAERAVAEYILAHPGRAVSASVSDLAGSAAAVLGGGVSPMHGRPRWLDRGSPVVIDGMTVRNGDVIHADENGALCLPAELASAVVDKAGAVRDKEGRVFKMLRLPGMTLDGYLESLKR